MPETPVTSPHRRTPRSRLAALFVLLSLGSASWLAPAGPAAADPIAEKRAEAERLTRQIEEQEQQLSLLDEQANQANLKVAELEAARRQVEADLAEAQRRVDATRARLRDLAVEAYVGGGPLSRVGSLLDTDDGNRLAIRNGYLQATAARERQAIDALHAAREDLSDRKADLDENRAEAQAALDAAKAAAGQAETVLAEYRSTQARVQGELARLVEEERRRRAEEEARRLRARLEAERRAREEAARRVVAPVAPPPRRGVTAPTRPPLDDGPAPPSQPGAAAAVEEAKRQLGKPYEWGGSGPDSFDCSGLTAWAWRAGGVKLPHSSQAQWNSTRRVPLSAIQPGDLVFFGSPIHHVGIYVSDGQMIAAPHSGSHVKYQGIYRSDLVGVGRPG